LTGSSIRRELAAEATERFRQAKPVGICGGRNTTSTDPRSQRIREGREGRPWNELGALSPFYRRPARTFVVKAPRVPDGLTVMPSIDPAPASRGRLRTCAWHDPALLTDGAAAVPKRYAVCVGGLEREKTRGRSVVSQFDCGN